MSSRKKKQKCRDVINVLDSSEEDVPAYAFVDCRETNLTWNVHHVEEQDLDKKPPSDPSKSQHVKTRIKAGSPTRISSPTTTTTPSRYIRNPYVSPVASISPVASMSPPSTSVTSTPPKPRLSRLAAATKAAHSTLNYVIVPSEYRLPTTRIFNTFPWLGMEGVQIIDHAPSQQRNAKVYSLVKKSETGGQQVTYTNVIFETNHEEAETAYMIQQQLFDVPLFEGRSVIPLAQRDREILKPILPALVVQYAKHHIQDWNNDKIKEFLSSICSNERPSSRPRRLSTQEQEDPNMRFVIRQAEHPFLCVVRAAIVIYHNQGKEYLSKDRNKSPFVDSEDACLFHNLLTNEDKRMFWTWFEYINIPNLEEHVVMKSLRTIDNMLPKHLLSMLDNYPIPVVPPVLHRYFTFYGTPMTYFWIMTIFREQVFQTVARLKQERNTCVPSYYSAFDSDGSGYEVALYAEAIETVMQHPFILWLKKKKQHFKAATLKEIWKKRQNEVPMVTFLQQDDINIHGNVDYESVVNRLFDDQYPVCQNCCMLPYSETDRGLERFNHCRIVGPPNLSVNDCIARYW